MTNQERRREKLKNAVLYFVKNDKTVGLTKLMKLLFYLDLGYIEHVENRLQGRHMRRGNSAQFPPMCGGNCTKSRTVTLA